MHLTILKYDYHIYKSTLFGKPKPFAIFKFKTQLGSVHAELSCYDPLSTRSFNENLFQVLTLLERTTSFEELLSRNDLYPSVFFLLQMAYDGFKEQRTPTPPTSTAILFMAPQIEEIEHAYHQGSRVFKLKLKHLTVERTLLFLRDLTQKCKEIQLRLDFNLALNKESLSRLLKEVPLDHIDYIEEPSAELDGLLKAIQLYPNKIAIDESFRCSQELFYNQNAVFIIKPLVTPRFHTLIGNLKKNHKRVILSSCFESPFAIEYIKKIIHHHKLEDHHGYDTAKYYDYMPAL